MFFSSLMIFIFAAGSKPFKTRSRTAFWVSSGYHFYLWLFLLGLCLVLRGCVACFARGATEADC